LQWLQDGRSVVDMFYMLSAI
jgi:hypothetical protein